ncbi:phenylalanine--tRNA ligase beta subunit-related protein [Mycoplasmatota bacterium WC44]
MKITISNEILDSVPKFNIAVIKLNGNIQKYILLDEEINKIEEEIDNQYNIEDVIKIPNILDARNAYKAFGKDPSRYRLACESLFRRLSKGNKLYRINNAVDAGNLLSIKTQKSVAVLDLDEIKGDILIRLGKDTDDYHGIGRGKLNIDRIPLYEDDLGPFGSTTSDTERTMITSKTKNILVFIISFNGSKQLEEDINLCKEIFENFVDVNIISSTIIPKGE